ncbi:TonB family protein [Rhodoblastus sp.]|uniref:TonB family protein n=1 Tax=Rhodoblastus sp. TaxID=1962975 RepID=UPI0035B0B5ED
MIALTNPECNPWRALRAPLGAVQAQARAREAEAPRLTAREAESAASASPRIEIDSGEPTAGPFWPCGPSLARHEDSGAAPRVLRDAERVSDKAPARWLPSRAFALSVCGHLGGLVLIVTGLGAVERAEALRGGEMMEVSFIASSQQESVAAEPAPAAQDKPEEDKPAPEAAAETEKPQAEIQPPQQSMSAPETPPPKVAPAPEAEQAEIVTRAPPKADAAPAAPTRPNPPPRPMKEPVKERIKEHAETHAERAPPHPRRKEAAADHPSGHGAETRRTVAAVRGGTQGAPDSAGAAASQNWRGEVLAHLARFKQYPSQAQDRDVTGRTIVSFVLSPSGGVQSVSLAGSSGSSLLDQTTLAMVRRAAPFPHAPPGAKLSFTAAINYSLH